jgi:hypothetical protein
MFIIKPEAGCQGKGIFIAHRLEDLQNRVESNLKRHNAAYNQYLKQEEAYETALKYGHQRQSEDAAPEVITKEHSYVVQKYISRPALHKGHKYDFRIYVLLLSVSDPLTIFIYKDGLVRLASEKYTVAKTVSKQESYVHLTNYSLNKNNANYNNTAHKLKLSEILQGSIS